MELGEYATVEEAWWGEDGPEQEGILLWEFVNRDEFEKTRFKIIDIDPVEWYRSAPAGSRETIQQSYKDAHKDRKSLVAYYRKRAKMIANDSVLIVNTNENLLIDGYHRLTAMALEKIRHAKALDLSQEEGIEGITATGEVTGVARHNPWIKTEHGSALYTLYDHGSLSDYVTTWKWRLPDISVTTLKSELLFPVAEINEAEIRNEFRGSGKGKALVNAIEAEAKANGARSFLLVAAKLSQEDKHPAAFWERMGYKRVYLFRKDSQNGIFAKRA